MMLKPADNLEHGSIQDNGTCKIETEQYEVVNAWPHDPKAFTEGLEFFNGVLFESTGGDKGTPDIELSSLRRVDPQTGKVLQKLPIDKEFFAEGLTILGDRIFQLTYRSYKGFIYDLKSFILQGEFSYSAGINEGWGLTHNDQHLIMSDGTNCIRFLDPVHFEVFKTIFVNDGNTPLFDLNELEYVKGEIFGNILGDNRIVRIDPKLGKILGWIDLTALRPPYSKVLNGIAQDKATGHLYITGKDWPTLFEIRLK